MTFVRIMVPIRAADISVIPAATRHSMPTDNALTERELVKFDHVARVSG
jgi:alanine-alpha-ketoisovalerate/valine-pyruvate aminotransferase